MRIVLARTSPVAFAVASNAPEPAWLRRILSATLVFNLVDAVLTLWLVTVGAAEEANPLMAAALKTSPLLFMILKMGIVSGGVLYLWSHRGRRLAHVGGLAVFFVYMAVMAWHVQSVEALAAWIRAAA